MEKQKETHILNKSIGKKEVTYIITIKCEKVETGRDSGSNRLNYTSTADSKGFNSNQSVSKHSKNGSNMTDLQSIYHDYTLRQGPLSQLGAHHQG